MYGVLWIAGSNKGPVSRMIQEKGVVRTQRPPLDLPQQFITFLYPLFCKYVLRLFNRFRLVLCSHCMSSVVDNLLVCNSLTNTTWLLSTTNVQCVIQWWLVKLFHQLFTIQVFFPPSHYMSLRVLSPYARPLCGFLTTITIITRF